MFPSTTPHLIFEKGSLTKPVTHQFFWTSWPIDAPISKSVVLGFTDEPHHTWLFSWGPRSKLKSSCSMHFLTKSPTQPRDFLICANLISIAVKIVSCFILLINYYHYYYYYRGMYIPCACVQARGQFCRIVSFFPPSCGFWEENSAPGLCGSHLYLLSSFDGLSCFIFELPSKYKLA